MGRQQRWLRIRRICSGKRNITRCTLRSPARRSNRRLVRVRWRTPDDLGEALSALTQVMSADRRLARLAPQFFDAAVVQREAENRAEERRWRAIWEPALLRVYGPEPDLPTATEETCPLPPARIQRVVERELAKRECWMQVATAAWKRHKQRHPHALPSLGRVARLIQLACDFKNLALGLNSPNPVPEKLTYDYELTNLKHEYGHLFGNPLALQSRVDAGDGWARARARLFPSESPLGASP